MKWMFVIMIFGTQPVKTDLLFDTVVQCSAVADVVRKQVTDEYNKVINWGKQQDRSLIPDFKDFEADRWDVLGVQNKSACIPHR
jgi:hypothetical protein